MTDQSTEVFGKTVPSAASTDAPKDTPTAPVLSDELAALVGEGKKYATAEEALNSVPHAQSFITNLEKENNDMRAELDSREKVASILEQIKSAQSPSALPADTALTPEDVQTLIANTLDETATAKAKTDNVNKASDAIVAKFGDKASEVVASKAKDMGATVEYLQEIAATNPDIFIALFNTNTGTTHTPTPTGNIVPDNLNLGTDESTYAYFSKLRKEHPAEYRSVKSQQRMHKLAKENPNFYK